LAVGVFGTPAHMEGLVDAPFESSIPMAWRQFGAHMSHDWTYDMLVVSIKMEETKFQLGFSSKPLHLINDT
jgi:hypothetical protein